MPHVLERWVGRNVVTFFHFECKLDQSCEQIYADEHVVRLFSFKVPNLEFDSIIYGATMSLNLSETENMI